jgi:hypothetical protein
VRVGDECHYAAGAGGPVALRMGRVWLLGLALLLAAPDQAVAGAGEACRDQAAIAERAAGIPRGLLLAIGKRESGRFDQEAGGVLPWPWAVNREGRGRLFETRQEAMAYVTAAMRDGSRSIDVGCFQINLKYHPLAFASVEQGFDPAANAAYAARFLMELHGREGSWETAVADYHSATPGLGIPYREAVYATWLGLSDVASASSSAAPAPYRLVMGIRVWTPGIGMTSAGRAAGPVVVRAAANLPRVFTPSGSVGRIGG